MTDKPVEEFQDPLQNYDPPVYDDALREALMEQPVAAIQSQPFSSVPPDTPVCEALEKLVGQDIACLMVTENEQLVGVFSDRDVMEYVALQYDEVRDKPVSEIMTKNPICVHDTDSSAATLGVMAASGYRHVPVVDADEKVVGIVGPQRVMAFLQEHFQDEQ